MRDAGRYRDALLPLILIVAGVIALLINAHVLSQQAIDNLGALWPLFFVVVGVYLVLRFILPPRTATISGLAVAAVVVVAALAVAIAGPPIVPLGTGTLDSSAALGEAGKASLSLEAGGAAVTIRGQDLGTQAYRAHLEYPKGQPAPRIRFTPAGNALEIRSSEKHFPFFESGNRSVDLTLSTHLPWSVSLGGGASDVSIAGPHLQLSDLTIGGGAGNVDAVLGAPKGTEVIDVSGGASDVTLHVPKGSQWRVRVSGGASSINVDGQDLSADSEVSRASPGFDAAGDRYDIQISGGASDVTVDTNGSAS